ncbi:MAG: hypothetical protein HC921_15815 [Synechococcaceae cyanobacterium SM2_3_1]|nr:hypothetical protein [Synechococcaceae cyanobacterium SM2_3_1]
MHREAIHYQDRYAVKVIPRSLFNLFESAEEQSDQPQQILRKVISFSLWGQNPRYTHGAVENARLALQIYPAWQCRFYIDSTVPFDIIQQLNSLENVEIIEMPKPDLPWQGSFWRFYVLGDPDVDIAICRDADSRLGWREKAAVDQWLESGLPFHIIRDHPLHQDPILAGLFGYQGTIANIEWLIECYLFNHEDCQYLIDQKFLGEVIYPFARYQALTHDEFYGGEPFPSPRQGIDYAGQPFPIYESRGYDELLHQYLSIQRTETVT